MHQIYSYDHNIETLLGLFRHFENIHDLYNDTALTSRQVALLWPQLKEAIARCKRQGGTTNANLKELTNVVMDMGGDRIGWQCLLEMDSSGKLAAAALPV